MSSGKPSGIRLAPITWSSTAISALLRTAGRFFISSRFAFDCRPPKRAIEDQLGDRDAGDNDEDDERSDSVRCRQTQRREPGASGAGEQSAVARMRAVWRRRVAG